MRILDTTLMGLTAGLMVLSLGGCKKTPEDSDSDTEVVDDTSDTSDTGTNTYAEPYWFQITGVFGYNSSDGTAIGFKDVANNLDWNPTLFIDLFEDDGGAPGADICTLTVSKAGPFTETTTLGGVTVLTGFEMTGATVDHDCDGKVDPAVWPSDLTTALSSVGWGLAVTGALPTNGQTYTDLKGLVDQDTSTDWNTEWADYVVGAAPYSSIFGLVQISNADVSFTRGATLDTTQNPAVVDYNTRVLASDVINGPVTAEFDVLTIYALNFGVPLDEVFFP